MTASSRGLFRATGNKSKPQPVRLLDGSYSKTETVEREKDDFYPTPSQPTQSLLYREAWRLRDFATIWEPACGNGQMANDILASFDGCGGVYQSDLVDRGCGAIIKDFFSFTEPLSPCIITNPPYNLVNTRDGNGRWIWHALDVLKVDYMALLLNWSWPGAGGTRKLWSEHPPARVYLMRWKIDFTGGGAPPMLHGWFVWDCKHTGPTQLLMMDRKDISQSQLFGDTA